MQPRSGCVGNWKLPAFNAYGHVACKPRVVKRPHHRNGVRKLPNRERQTIRHVLPILTRLSSIRGPIVPIIAVRRGVVIKQTKARPMAMTFVR
jgi:hypothetical protein